MTGSNPHLINAFMKAPLFPWSHTPSLAPQSPETRRTPQCIQPSRTQKPTHGVIVVFIRVAARLNADALKTQFVALSRENLSEEVKSEV